MPTITIRLRDDEKAKLESAAHAAGQSLSEYVRDTLALRDDPSIAGLNVRVEVLWDKVARLEQIAGL